MSTTRVAAASGFGGVALPGAAAAHHSGGRDGSGPWLLLSLLVLALAFLAFWIISTVLERREKEPRRPRE